MTRRNVPLWLLFTLTHYTPLYWPYMFHLVTVVRGLSAAEFGALKGLYYLVAIAAEVPAGVTADRLSRRGAMLVGAFLNGVACEAMLELLSLLSFAGGDQGPSRPPALHFRRNAGSPTYPMPPLIRPIS